MFCLLEKFQVTTYDCKVHRAIYLLIISHDTKICNTIQKVRTNATSSVFCGHWILIIESFLKKLLTIKLFMEDTKTVNEPPRNNNHRFYCKDTQNSNSIFI